MTEVPVKVKKKPGVKPGDKLVTMQMKFDIMKSLRKQGFDPIDKMLELYDEAEELYLQAKEGYPGADGEKIIHNPWLVNTRWNMKLDIVDKLMEYIYPKRKAIELTGENGGDVFKSFIDVVKSVREEMEKEKAIDVSPQVNSDNV
ncbi:MAG: hypothetical protein ACK5YR_16475 [Pirellula sp.]